jgi:predicted component of type VI protein secretion system
MLGAPERMEAPRVRVVEGSPFGDELVLTDEGREYLIGRGPKCDLVIDDREVSREHVKVMRKGYSVYVQDLSSTRGSWLGRSTVYTGATVEWSRPRMLRVGATVLSLELPEAIRRSAPGAQASAPMTPPPRRRGVGSQTTTPSPGVTRGSNALTPAPSQPPPGSAAAAALAEEVKATRKIGSFQLDGAVPPSAPAAAAHPAASTPAPVTPGSSPRALGSLPPPSRKAWKKTGPTIGKASGLLLLALAGLVILGGLFVVFSLLE